MMMVMMMMTMMMVMMMMIMRVIHYDDDIPPVSLFAGLALTRLLVWWPHRDDVPEHHDDDFLDH